jgi:hypothetical protein
MWWRRQLVAWLGLLCVLWHAGAAVHHHVVALDPTALVRTAAATSDEARLLRDVMLALCRPGLAAPATGTTRDGTPPDGTSPCPDCCPSAPSVLADPIRTPHPAREPLALRVAWQAIQASIAERTAERPPVRGPPLA